MTPERRALELLAPARDLEVGVAAVDHGADAVYIGGPGFGARAAAGNSLEDIGRLCEYAHRFHARVFMTLNTLVYNEEFDEALELAHAAKAAGVDALILQDMGLASSPDFPDIEIHASTQCDIRTPEKAALMDAMGFSQVVLARELTLEEIARCRAAMPRSRIEVFVHGALCVSYSGRCYLSCAQCSRSANRGECAQPCRLPYSVFDHAGNELVRRKHVLSLKDNDQSENLAQLVAAGVSSFKIEGRLKGVEYVKNITAFYRGKIDRFLASDAGRDYRASSLGQCRFTFEPDPAKTFHRDRTDYFVHGRQDSIAELDTPKSTGEFAGTVVAVNRRTPQSFDVRCAVTLANGDGLVYRTAEDELEGLYVNRVEELGRGLARIHLHEPLARHPHLRAGVKLNRNRDRLFTKELSGKSAERSIAIDMTLTLDQRVSPAALVLQAKIPETEFTASRTLSLEAPDAARDQIQARRTMHTQLAKTGGTDFTCRSVALETIPADSPLPFLPASALNALRRDVLGELSRVLLHAHEETHRLPDALCDMHPDAALVTENCANELAAAFARSLGASVVPRAFELARTKLDLTAAELMRCRHCIRHTLGLCPKMLKGSPEKKEAFKKANGGHLKPLPLILVNDKGERLIARFDCRACEMTISFAPDDVSTS